jgi:hypothetical protein
MDRPSDRPHVLTPPPLPPSSSSSSSSTKQGSRGGPNSTFTTPAAAGAKGTFGVGSPITTGGAASQPKRMNLEKLKEAEEYRIKAAKMLKARACYSFWLVGWVGGWVGGWWVRRPLLRFTTCGRTANDRGRRLTS